MTRQENIQPHNTKETKETKQDINKAACTHLTNIQFPGDTECARTVPNACMRMSTLLVLLEDDVAPKGTPDTITHTSQEASYDTIQFNLF